jgi:transcriptional regulator with XRE-family HTH domain
MQDVESQEVFRLLRGISKELGFSQQDVANHCGVSRITIQRFFSGKTEIGAMDLVKVLRLLGIDVVQLLKEQDHRVLNGKSLEREASLHKAVSYLESFEPGVKDTIIEQIHWWERNGRGAV